MGGGTVSVAEIASQFAQQDQALIEYYSRISGHRPRWSFSIACGAIQPRQIQPIRNCLLALE